MRRLFALTAGVVLAGALSIGIPTSAFAAEPVGHYGVQGKNPDNGDTYEGTVDVTKTGDTFHVVWKIGSDTFVGTAIGNDKFMAITYRSGNTTGLALFGEDGNNWLGPWTEAGGTTLGAEKWTRQ